MSDNDKDLRIYKLKSEWMRDECELHVVDKRSFITTWPIPHCMGLSILMLTTTFIWFIAPLRKYVTKDLLIEILNIIKQINLLG